ncbi:carboxymuconolactone decarboxylase family protein [Pseudooceanicola sp. MF1-13]|uniref:carboxymuconolactone decarboxylase family protein n=1 Tax=Pseudooceanicola sp. MF1-13 TaxID=3379095 RepID=UPI003892B7EB
MTDWPAQRLMPPDPATYTAKQQEAHDAFANSKRKAVRGPLALWIHRPELAIATQNLGSYLRFENSLGPKLTELAILTTAKVWGSEFEWYAHKPMAVDAGLSDAVIQAIRAGTAPPYEADEERAVHEYAAQAAVERQISDDLYDRTISVLGKDRLIDLVALIGYYGFVSLTLNTFNILPPEEAEREIT